MTDDSQERRRELLRRIHALEETNLGRIFLMVGLTAWCTNDQLEATVDETVRSLEQAYRRADERRRLDGGMAQERYPQD